MPAVIDHTGQRFGRLVVTGPASKPHPRAQSMWAAVCDCGNPTTVAGPNLRKGCIVSCGCLQKEVSSARMKRVNYVHGQTDTPTWRSWSAMLARCTNRQHRAYAAYGGRGITVCERWLQFENFLSDMGERPAATTIDREDNDGNYEPGNCRWATTLEQNRNKRTVRHITVGGKTLTILEWAAELGIHPSNIYRRIYKGWSPEAAVTAPVDKRNGTRSPAR